MPRGGKRQGTPGVAHANRTDLNQNYDMDKNTAASGGMVAPAPEQRPQAGPPSGGMDGLMAMLQGAPSPDDTPLAGDPTQRPNEPITEGLPTGPGGGPSRDQRPAETAQLKRYLPLLAPYLDQPDVPDSVRMLFRYIKSS